MPVCEEHSELIREISKAAGALGEIKFQMQELSRDTKSGIEKIYIEQSKMADSVRSIHTDAVIAKGEAQTAKIQLSEYRSGHDSVHRILIWAFGIATAGVSVQASLAIAKAIGWI